MTSRALARAGLQPVPHIDIPSTAWPQQLDNVDIDRNEEEAQDLGVDGVQVEEALLNLADSLVLPFTLLQTRQHHLSHLLPHIFSHPPVPSHSKPRPKPLPKNTFIFPTPQLEIPLPLKEYHAPSRPAPGPSTPTPNTPTPGPSTETDPSAEPSTAKGKGKEKAKSKARDKNDAPAHEIECVARITLTVGAISFPGTELWIGRFLEPRQDSLKYARRKDPAAGTKVPRKEKVERERKRPANPLLPTHGRTIHNAARPSPGSSIGTQAGPVYRPPVTGVRPPMRPPSGSMPSRPPIEPTLIQRVNQAATQHPWLSVIIHKAARNNATKEELAKLGRIVARLGRGEGIGEGPTEGITKPSGSAPSAGPSPVARPPAVRPPPTNGSSTLPQDDSDDSDKEVDMSGRPQVGGGPIDPRLLSPTPRQSGSVASSPTGRAASSAMSPAPSSPMSSVPDIPPTSAPAPALPPPTQQPIPGPNFTDVSARPPIPPAPAVPRGPPAPPRRVYPLPPPFLLVAFKETPTEKYLLPLGSQSYISRVGEPSSSIGFRKYPEVKLQSLDPITEAKSSAVPVETPVANGTAKKKTRGSLARAEPPNATVDVTAPEAPHHSSLKDPTYSQPPGPRSHLPTLPGMTPPVGTVLLSTFIPINEWNKPDWESYERRMPFFTKEYDEKLIPPNGYPVKEELKDAATPAPAPSVSPKREPRSPLRHRSGQPPPDDSPRLDPKNLLNLGAENFMPPDGAVQAVTMRLEGIDDYAWRQIRAVIEHVETTEMKALGTVLPSLVETVAPPSPASIPQIFKPFDPALHPKLRIAYRQFRKAKFERLLQRVPRRSFPTFRLPTPRAEIKDALTDRWTPRPYPISTRPLYLTSPPPEGAEEEVEFEPQSKQKRKRGQEEDQVMFEMPVSLEMLDERVELGAKKSVNRRVGKLKMERKTLTGKRHGKRYVAGTICEGCARPDQKVWRRGPGGKGTLCNECGDKFSTGTLGELKAPGAAKRPEDPAEDEGEAVEDGGDDAPVEAEKVDQAAEAQSTPVKMGTIEHVPAVAVGAAEQQAEMATAAGDAAEGITSSEDATMEDAAAISDEALQVHQAQQETSVHPQRVIEEGGDAAMD